jgi:hypothetical protein
MAASTSLARLCPSLPLLRLADDSWTLGTSGGLSMHYAAVAFFFLVRSPATCFGRPAHTIQFSTKFPRCWSAGSSISFSIPNLSHAQSLAFQRGLSTVHPCCSLYHILCMMPCCPISFLGLWNSAAIMFHLNDSPSRRPRNPQHSMVRASNLHLFGHRSEHSGSFLFRTSQICAHWYISDILSTYYLL